jgi:isopentenyl-diphosphate delta-isomerase
MTIARPLTAPEADRVILVDEDARAVGTANKVEAHAGAGLLHRAFSVFLFDGDGRVLLQQRSAGKPLWPGFWANSCCSHPRPGESVEEAASRRVLEELDIECTPDFLYKFQYQANYSAAGSEHELCYVLAARTDQAAKPDPDEISATQFMTPSALSAALAENPDIYSPWLRLEWPRLVEDHLEDILAI